MQAESPASRTLASLRSLVETARELSRLQVAAIAVALMIAAGGALLLYVRSKPREVTIGPGRNEAVDSRLCVHVSGAVRRPGLYELKSGSRVSEALSKAGGVSEGADMENVNLAQKVKDGQKITVMVTVPAPVAGKAPNPDGRPEAGGARPGTVNINTADREQLETLPGIGPSLAERIIEYRESNGSFSSIEELDSVEGIGPSKLETLQDLVTL